MPLPPARARLVDLAEALPAGVRLVRHLGGGGSAEVLLVEQAGAEPPRRALKLLHADTPLPALSAFSREFRLLASLEHPALARVYEFGESGGRAFYTAEWVDGAELGAAEPTDLRSVCLAAASVCRALGYLHGRGYLHNDVKPANVVVPHARAADAKLLDLGLAGAAVAGRRPGGATPMRPASGPGRAAPGFVAGTPGFIAPERLRGGEVDGRADLFSLGATLYRVLAGRRVVTRERPTDALAQLAQGVPPLSAVRPDLPEGISRLVEQLLAIDPDRRPARAAGVIRGLGDVLGESLPLETPGSARCHALADLLIGRDDELARIEAGLASIRGGRPGARLLVIAGAPGIGTTRLLREIGTRAATGGWRLVPRWMTAATLTDGANPAQTARRLCADGPCLLSLDRAEQAADAVFGAALDAARAAAHLGLPLAVALALDPSALPASIGARLGGVAAGGDAAVRVDLGPLDAASVARMLDSLFGTGVFSAKARGSIAERSGGQPLLVEEMVRDLVERGALVRAASGWLLADPSALAEAGAGGDRLEAHLRRRVATLDAGAFAALSALAALGGRAPGPSVAALVGAAVDAPLALARLVDRALVRREGERFALSCDALREVALAMLAPEARRSLHTAAATRLDLDGGPREARVRALREGGEAAAALREALAAAREATSGGEGRAAVRWLDHANAALAAGGGDAASGPEVLALATDAYRVAGRPREALVAAEAGYPVTSGAERARLATSAVRSAIDLLDAQQMDRWLARAREAAAPRSLDPAIRAEVMRVSALVPWHRGRVAEARAELRRALAAAERAAEAGGRTQALARTHASTLYFLGFVEVHFEAAMAIKLARAGLAEAEAIGDRFLLDRARTGLGAVAQFAGDVATAARLFGQARRSAEAAGNLVDLRSFLANLAEIEQVRGRRAKARGLLDRAVGISGPAGAGVDLRPELARFAWRDGDFAEAGMHARQVLGDDTMKVNRMATTMVAAAAAAEHGNRADAARAAQAARGLAADAQTPWHRAIALLCAGYAAAARDPKLGVAKLTRGVVMLERTGRRDDLFPVLRDVAAWAARARDPRAAGRWLDRARAERRRQGAGQRELRRLDGIVLAAHAPARRQAGGPVAALFSARTLDDVGRAVSGVAAALGVRGDALLLARTDVAFGSVAPRSGETVGASAGRLCRPERGGYGGRSKAELPVSTDGLLRRLGDGAAPARAVAAAAAGALESQSVRRARGMLLVPIRAGASAAAEVVLAIRAPSPRLAADAGPLLPHALAAALALVAERRERESSAATMASPARDRTTVARTRHSAIHRTAPAEARLLELTLGPLELRHEFPEVLGRGSVMRPALALLDRLADSDATVLLVGETGTGKEVLARSLHAASARAAAPCVAVNCAAVPAGVFESELFGHRRGAFSGAVRDHAGLVEQAAGGTLFLDEVGDLPLDLQPKILRLLQEHRVRPLGANAEIPVDVRIVAATHRDLRRMVESGSFRQDLFFRLDVVEVRVPPLRERRVDIPELARHLLARRGLPTAVTRAAMRTLELHTWPGNVRELENELVRAAVLADGTPIERRHLSPHVLQLPSQESAAAQSPGASLRSRLADAERQILRDALGTAGGNRTRAAAALRLGRAALLYRMKRLGVR